MSKKKFSIIKSVLIVLICVLLFNLFYQSKENRMVNSEYKKYEESTKDYFGSKSEIDMQKELLKAKTQKAERMIEQISNEVEFILLSESGDYSLYHSKTSNSNNFVKWAANSEVTLNVNYSAILSIAAKNIHIVNVNGSIVITYEPTDITVKSIEFNDIVPVYNRHWFGDKYTNEEILALVDNSKSDLYERINNDSEIKNKCVVNLNSYLSDVANSFGVSDYTINTDIISSGYSFEYPGEIKYNHPNETLGNVEYIVIHSTGVKNINAMDFYNRFNTNPDLKVSSHFLVDDKNIVQCLPTNKVSWNCGSVKENKIAAGNYNTISIEMCEIGKDEQVIKNTADFVNTVLKVQFPNAKVIKHRDIKATECPSILSDAVFDEYF